MSRPGKIGDESNEQPAITKARLTIEAQQRTPPSRVPLPLRTTKSDLTVTRPRFARRAPKKGANRDGHVRGLACGERCGESPVWNTPASGKPHRTAGLAR